MGVASLKIEGRMKRPEYVAAAVHAYRLALDGAAVDSQEAERLKTVFSRGGLTAAYYEDQRGSGMFGRRTGEDSRAAKETYAPLHALYRTERQSVKVTLSLEAEENRLILTAQDDEGNAGRSCLATGTEELPALESERLERQLQKSGGTPFAIDSVLLPAGNVRVRLSQINELRRQALDSLMEQRAAKRPVPLDAQRWQSGSTVLVSRTGAQRNASYNRQTLSEILPLWVRFGKPSQLPEALEPLRRMERVFLPVEWEDGMFHRLLDAGIAVGMDLPRGFFGREEALVGRMGKLGALGVTSALAHNVASVRAAAELGLRVCASDGLNISNAPAARSLRQAGAAEWILNPELTLSQAEAVGEGGLLLYGRLPLMLTRNCPVANGGDCRFLGGNCEGQGWLSDRKGIDFPVVCRFGCSEVLNSRPLWMADRLHETTFASFGMLWLTVETPEEASHVLTAYEQGGPPPEEYTRGLYYRGSSQTRASGAHRTRSAKTE